MSMTQEEQQAFEALNQGINKKKQEQNQTEELFLFDDDPDEPKQENNYDKYKMKNQKYNSVDQVSNTKSQIEDDQKQLSQLPSITKDSGYYYKNKQQPKKFTKKDVKISNSNMINILNNEEDIGEVGEWVEKTAKEENKQEDDEFDVFDNKPVPNSQNIQSKQQTSYNSDQIDKINQKLQQKGTQLSRRQGPIVNNLKEKAKEMALQNNSINDANHNISKKKAEIIHSDPEGEEDNEEQQEGIQESPDKKIFSIAHNSIERKLSVNKSASKEESKEVDIWEMVNQEHDLNLLNKKPKEQIKVIIFIDAWDQLKQDKTLRESINIERINPNNNVGLFSRLFGCFTVHLKTSKLINERNQVCSLSMIQYEDSQELHFQILYSIYCLFMNTDFCQRYGSHWENIGFQGRDPATDLRGAGLLGLLQILAFLQNYNVNLNHLYQKKEYITDCLIYSKNDNVSFPLCVTLINITTFSIQGLKENRFNTMINREQSVMSVANKVYFSGFYYFFSKYKQQYCLFLTHSIRSRANFHTIGEILRLTRDAITKQPQKLVEDFNRGIALYYKNKND